MRDQKKQGILISYVNIVLSTLVNIVLTPILIASLTDEGYSIYKIMRSFAGPLAMLNLGVSTVVARNIAKYLACENASKKEKENMQGIALLLSIGMGALIMAAGYVMQMLIPSMYAETFSAESIRLAQQMFMVFTGTTAIHILTEPFRGAIMGHGRFILYYGSQSFQYAFRFAAIYLLVNAGYGALSVAVVDLVVSAIILLAYCIYVFFVLRERVRLYYIDKRTLLEFSSFALAILLQAFVNQVNNNLDIIILGASEAADVITMYSSALTIYSVYNMLISVFSGVYLPQATRLVEGNASGEELTDFVIKPGRVQAMIAVCIVGGFAVSGMDFISIWIGSQYINAYYVALFLMIPVTIPLVESVAIAILDAKLKRVFRSVVLMVMAVVNAAATVVLVHFFGFWGALLGTIGSLLLGHGLLMNLYYQRSLSMNVFRMFREIFAGSLGAGLLATAICFPLSFLINGTLFSFLLKAGCFVIAYGVFLLWFGLRGQERRYIARMTNRLFRKETEK